MKVRMRMRMRMNMKMKMKVGFAEWALFSPNELSFFGRICRVLPLLPNGLSFRRMSSLFCGQCSVGIRRMSSLFCRMSSLFRRMSSHLYQKMLRRMSSNWLSTQNTLGICRMSSLFLRRMSSNRAVWELLILRTSYTKRPRVSRFVWQNHWFRELVIRSAPCK